MSRSDARVTLDDRVALNGVKPLDGANRVPLDGREMCDVRGRLVGWDMLDLRFVDSGRLLLIQTKIQKIYISDEIQKNFVCIEVTDSRICVLINTFKLIALNSLNHIDKIARNTFIMFNN